MISSSDLRIFSIEIKNWDFLVIIMITSVFIQFICYISVYPELTSSDLYNGISPSLGFSLLRRLG